MTRFGLTIPRVLLGGLVTAVVLLLAGVVLTVARPGLVPVHDASIAGIPGAIRALQPGGFFDLGLLVLLATPVVRVMALLISFGRRRMWLFSAFCLIVLAALAVSVVLGL